MFTKDYSSLTARLRELLLERTKWKWDLDHQHAFETLKEQLENTCLLNYFDPQLNTEVICDASPVGVGAVLAQYDQTTQEKKVVAYASRSLTPTEQRYGQIEREALAILFGCTKFRLYLLGKQFDLYTDHKPLRVMFNNPRSQAPFRVERIRLKLQGFEFTVKYINGSKNPTDYMSRHSLPATKDDLKHSKELEAHVNMVLNTVDELVVSKDNIKDAIAEDEEARNLKMSILFNKLNDTKYPSILKLKKVFNELSVVDGLILKGSRLFIPTKLRKRILIASHDGHQGIVKTKQLLRSKVWYPGMDKDT